MAVYNPAFPETDERLFRDGARPLLVRTYVPSLSARTPEEIENDRRDLMSRFHSPIPLPPGESLEQVIVGQWPGDETDEQIAAALAELS